MKTAMKASVLMAKPAMKIWSKPAAKAVPKVPKPALKPPKGLKKPVIKVAVDKALRKTTTCHNLSSLWHKRTQSAYTKAGFSADVAKTAAREKHSELVELWNANLPKAATKK